MSSGKTGAPSLDLPALLSSATLRLAANLRTAETRGKLLVVKNDTDRRYLVVAHAQWELLERFARGNTVSNVLCEIISENHCPPLREFYELVVNAYRHGVLQVDGQPVKVYVTPAKWRVSLPPGPARVGSLAAIATSLLVLSLAPAHLPTQTYQVVIGLVLALVAISLGNVLAACTLRGAKCAVYNPRFVWKSLLPGFRANLNDAVMGGTETELNVVLVRFVPSFLFAAAAALKAQPYYLPLLAGVVVQLSPLWPTPMWDLLRILFRNPRMSTRTHFVFASSRPFALLSQAKQQFADRQFLLAGVAVNIGWLALLFATGCLLFHANAVDVLHRFYAAGGLRYTGFVVGGLLAAAVLGFVALVAWIVLGHVRAWWRDRAARRRRLQIDGKSSEAIADLLAGIVMFRDLPPDALKAVAATMRPVEFKRGEFVIRVGEEATRLFVVVAGRLEVIRHFTDGKSGAVTVAEMIPGDILGEVAVVRGGTRTRSIRCATRTVLLALEKADFEKHVLSHLTRAAVEDAVQKVGFLQNIELVKNWPQQSLAAFARLTQFYEYNEGDLVVREGTENLYLFLVHRGEFAVTQHGKLVRKLKQGDSYGELGILKNSTTTTSVTATKPGSCLVVSKADFLKFITQDFTISLQFEELGTKRHGRKVFSGKAPGFDVIRA